MITRIPNFLFSIILFAGGARGFVVTNDSSFSSALKYSNAVADDVKLESYRNSILKSYQAEEPKVSVAQLLTKQIAREFTAGRRYLLAASAVKELSEEFYAAEEQQRFRAMELIEYARAKGIALARYDGQVERTPIDKSLPPAEFVKELLLQEQKDKQVLDQVMMQASANQDLVFFLQAIKADLIERQLHMLHTLTESTSATPSAMDTLSAVSSTAADSAHSGITASRINGDFLDKVDVKDMPQAVTKWYENQMQVFGRHLDAIISRASHVSATGATAATAAVVDSVDPESLPTTEDILQVMDSASTILEEPSQLVDTLQQTFADTDSLSHIVDLVSGLY